MRDNILSTFHSVIIALFLVSSLGCAVKGDPFYKETVTQAQPQKALSKDEKSEQ